MREIIFREFQSRDRFAFLNFDWSSRSLFFNSFFRGFLYWQNDVEKFSIKFISIPRKDIGFFRSFEDPNLKSDTPLIEGKEKKRSNPFRPIVPPPLEELGNCGQLTRIFNSVIIGRSRWYFEGKVFHASQREKLLTPFKFHPSWNRNFCHDEITFQPSAISASFFPGQGGGEVCEESGRENLNIAGKFRIHRRWPARPLERKIADKNSWNGSLILFNREMLHLWIITQKVIRFVKRVRFREDENRLILRWRSFDDVIRSRGIQERLFGRNIMIPLSSFFFKFLIENIYTTLVKSLELILELDYEF